MEIQELRIGNVVLGLEGEWLRVHGVMEGGKIITSHIDNDFKFENKIENIKSIELDDKVLDILGFEEFDKNMERLNNIEGYDLLRNKLGIITIFNHMAYQSIATIFQPITTLHQLQNIFYDLTKEELI